MTVARGASFSIDVTTFNSGSGAAGASLTGFRLSPDTNLTNSDSGLGGGHSVGALAASGSASATVNVVIPAATVPGVYTFGACADFAKVITESSETNQCLAAPGTIQITP